MRYNHFDILYKEINDTNVIQITVEGHSIKWTVVWTIHLTKIKISIITRTIYAF